MNALMRARPHEGVGKRALDFLPSALLVHDPTQPHEGTVQQHAHVLGTLVEFAADLGMALACEAGEDDDLPVVVGELAERGLQAFRCFSRDRALDRGEDRSVESTEPGVGEKLRSADLARGIPTGGMVVAVSIYELDAGSEEEPFEEGPLALVDEIVHVLEDLPANGLGYIGTGLLLADKLIGIESQVAEERREVALDQELDGAIVASARLFEDTCIEFIGHNAPQRSHEKRREDNILDLIQIACQIERPVQG